jgi:transcriptional regulator with XRE-family HTH domain
VAAERKLYLGGRLRRLRRDFGLNQSAMAGELGVSPSYLNHLERNQRPVTAQVLLRLAQAYDVDLKSFTAEGDGTGPDDLAEIFADPMFSDLAIPRYELVEVADNAPSVADAISRLYTALLDRRSAPSDRGRPAGHPRNLGARSYPGATQPLRLSRGSSRDPGRGAGRSALAVRQLRKRLKDGFGIDSRTVPPETLDAASQHYDYHRKRLMLSELLRPESRTFAVAYQLALFEFRPLLARMLDAAAPPDAPKPPHAAHEPGQLCGRRDHHALCRFPRRGRASSLRPRPALRRVRGERRAGRPPADHARPLGRARHSLSSC